MWAASFGWVSFDCVVVLLVVVCVACWAVCGVRVVAVCRAPGSAVTGVAAAGCHCIAVGGWPPGSVRSGSGAVALAAVPRCAVALALGAGIGVIFGVYPARRAARLPGLDPAKAMRSLQRFLDHIEKHDRVWVTRRIDIARHWKATHPFDPATAFLWE